MDSVSIAVVVVLFLVIVGFLILLCIYYARKREKLASELEAANEKADLESECGGKAAYLSAMKGDIQLRPVSGQLPPSKRLPPNVTGSFDYHGALDGHPYNEKRSPRSRPGDPVSTLQSQPEFTEPIHSAANGVITIPVLPLANIPQYGSLKGTVADDRLPTATAVSQHQKGRLSSKINYDRSSDANQLPIKSSSVFAKSDLRQSDKSGRDGTKATEKLAQQHRGPTMGTLSYKSTEPTYSSTLADGRPTGSSGRLPVFTGTKAPLDVELQSLNVPAAGHRTRSGRMYDRRDTLAAPGRSRSPSPAMFPRSVSPVPLLYTSQELQLSIVHLESLSELVVTVKRGKNFDPAAAYKIRVRLQYGDGGVVEYQDTKQIVTDGEFNPIWTEHLVFRNMSDPDLDVAMVKVSALKLVGQSAWEECGAVLLGNQSPHQSGRKQWLRVLAKEGIVDTWHFLASNL